MADTQLLQAPHDATLKVALRVFAFGDLEEKAQHFVLRTWIGQNTRFAGEQPDKLRKRCLELLKRPYTHVALLLFPDDTPEAQWRIVGFAVQGYGCVHYVYIRPSYRKQGLVSLLLPEPPPVVACTHWNRKLPLTGAWAHRGALWEYVGATPIPQPNR